MKVILSQQNCFLEKNERKFIPIIKEGRASEVLPTFLAGKLGIDLSDSQHYDENLDDLITTIFGVKRNQH